MTNFILIYFVGAPHVWLEKNGNHKLARLLLLNIFHYLRKLYELHVMYRSARKLKLSRQSIHFLRISYH